MQLTLRQKLNVIVGTATGAFLLLMAVSQYLNVGMDRQMTAIKDRYIPHVELGYRLESEFDAIGLALRDAVAAQDMTALAPAEELKAKLFAELDTARGVVEEQKINDLRAAIDDYFAIAVSTSKRLIARETGLDIVDAMTRMQAKRTVAEVMLKKVTTFNRAFLTEAFASISLAEQKSARIRLYVSAVCVIFISVISMLMGRALIAHLHEISGHLVLFGKGSFDQLIPIKGRDELSELSGQINVMAARIQSLMGEIESFSYSIAHDLRAPLRSMMGFSAILIEDHGASLSEEARSYLKRISNAAQRMGHMVDGLLNLSRLNRAPIRKQPVDLSKIVNSVLDVLKSNEPERKIALLIAENVIADGDSQLLDITISNLVGNAWKFTRRTADAQIKFGSKREGGITVYFVADNGAGFDMKYTNKLFGTFQRLHKESDFEGHGIGLATVKKIIDKHGGRIWAESEISRGATFYFTLG